MESNKYLIRQGKNKDINSILEIIDEARALFKTYNSPQWSDGYPNKETFLNDIKDDNLFVLVSDDKVIGTMTVLSYEPTYDYIEGKWLSDKDYVAIHRIAIKKEYRKLGLASIMIKFVEDKFKKNIRIDTHRLNKGMKEFLLKNGFVYCGIIYLNEENDKERLAFEKLID